MPLDNPLNPFNPTFPDYNKDLYPKPPKLQKNNVYIVMESYDVGLNDLIKSIGKPILVCYNYETAKIKCLNNPNRFVVGPIPLTNDDYPDKFPMPKFL